MKQAVAVKAVILRDGKALILKRRMEDEFERGIWDLPGGRVEWGENPVDALKREVLEETGLETLRPTPICVWDTHPSPDLHRVGVTFLIGFRIRFRGQKTLSLLSTRTLRGGV